MNHAREDIMDVLRQRRGLDPDDTSQDKLIQKMSARRAFDECCRWHIGPGDWASSILRWLRAAGYTVTEKDDD